MDQRPSPEAHHKEGIVEVVSRHWPGVRLVGRATGGHVNEVWFAEDGGGPFVVRRTRRSAAALDWELDLIESLADSLSVPRVLPADDGRRHVQGVVVQTRLPGRHPESVRDWELVREFLAELRRQGTQFAQRPGFRDVSEIVAAGYGGDIDLRVLPAEVAALCRDAWLPLVDLPTTVVHGDPGASNILIREDAAGLVDWDEARVDCAWLDMAALPDEVNPLEGDDLAIARRAAHAWEAAISWNTDREYAEWRLSQAHLGGR
jgi:Ser/Thr protein kinase RdoA (MazF antagonist)